MGGGGGSPPPTEVTSAPSGCHYQACHNWTGDGYNPCSGWTNHSIPSWNQNAYVNHFDNDAMSSYRVSGCENHLITAYQHDDYGGGSFTMLEGFNDVPHNDWTSSIKYTAVPTEEANRISVDTDGTCEGKATSYEKSGGKRYRCFWDDGDDVKAREFHAVRDANTNNATAFATLKEKFCSLSKNVFKNPGGGTCLEYDTAKTLAKEYCAVGSRIATDTNCSETNLGPTFQQELAEAYCRTTGGKADNWCACYNVTNNVCDTDSNAAGCATKRQQFDPLVAATPEGFRHVWSGRAACFGGVCQGNKYIPQNANQNCNAPIQICAQSFDLSQISESTIEAQCNLTAVQNIAAPGTPTPPSTPPSAGDSPAGPTPTPSSPSGSPPGSPSGSPPGSSPGPSGGLDDYIPKSLDELKTDSKKQMAVGGVGALFIMCCCLLLVVLASSGGGGRGNAGPTRFRR